MGRCIYCGHSAGFLANAHQACRDQHDYALARIPDFFPRFFSSQLPADRFCQLLQDGAVASYIDRAELAEAAERGIIAAIDSILADRFLTESESARFLETAEALANILPEDSKINERVTKANLLAQLAEGIVPDLVQVEGDLPLELGEGETVVWIFNDVTAYRSADGRSAGGLSIPLNIKELIPPGAFSELPESSDVGGGATGDFVVTNRTLFFVGDVNPIRRLPFARISRLRAFADGLQITCDFKEPWVRTVAFDDNWFATNLVAGLRTLSSPDHI